MACRIVVGLKDNVRDARGERVKREILEHLGIELESVRTMDVYTIDAQLADTEVVGDWVEVCGKSEVGAANFEGLQEGTGAGKVYDGGFGIQAGFIGVSEAEIIGYVDP